VTQWRERLSGVLQTWIPWAIIRVIVSDAIAVIVLVQVVSLVTAFVEQRMPAEMKPGAHFIEAHANVTMYGALAASAVLRLLIRLYREIAADIKGVSVFALLP
jgi:hypothetical protein